MPGLKDTHCEDGHELDEQNRFEFVSKRGYRQVRCRKCAAIKQRRRRLEKADEHRGYGLKSQYGITLAQYEEMFAAQGGVCFICGTDLGDKNLHVDHDRSCCRGKKSCGKCVRGLLCPKCNLGLGCFVDNPEFLLAAAVYLLQRQDLLERMT